MLLGDALGERHCAPGLCQREAGQENILLTGLSLLFRKDFDSGTYHLLATGTEFNNYISSKLLLIELNLLVVVALGLILARDDPLFDQDQGDLVLQRPTTTIWTH